MTLSDIGTTGLKHMIRISTISCLSALAITTAITAQAVSPSGTQKAPKSVLDGFQVRAASMQNLNLPTQNVSGFEVTVRIAGQDMKLLLRAHDMRSKGYKLLVHDQNGLHEAPKSANTTYRGMVEGYPKSRIAATLFRGQLSALIALLPNQPVWNVQPRTKVDKTANPKTHVIHSARDSVAPAHQCGVSGHGAPAQAPGSPSMNAAAARYAEIAIDADRKFHKRNGNDVSATQAAVFTVMNGVDLIYDRDLDIAYLITAVIVRTTTVYNGSTTGDRLVEMRKRWNRKHGDIHRDMAHLFTGVGSFSGVVGTAYIGVVCKHATHSYGVSKTFHASDSVNVAVVSHETGHNWGASHCAGSSCHLMCATIGSCGGDITKFGSGTKNVVTNFANSVAACLDRPEATSTSMGDGCIVAGAPPVLRVAAPRYGQEIKMMVECQALPNSAGVILVGFQDTVAIGACTAYINLSVPTVALFYFNTDTGGVWNSPTILVPTNPIFGLKFAVQGALDSWATAPLGMALTNGVWLKTGY